MSASVELTEAHFDRLVDRVAAKVADHVLAELAALLGGNATHARARWLDATEVADMLGISRDAVYRRADELGAVRIGSGPKARLRFDPTEVAAALTTCSESKDSLRSDRPPRQRPRARRSAPNGNAIPLLPVRGMEQVPSRACNE